jgi:hypothetical protein
MTGNKDIKKQRERPHAAAAYWARGNIKGLYISIQEESMDSTENVGIIFPEILIPEAKINLKKWSVIACDQFTSNEDYWVRTAKTVGGAPSTLHIIMPEVFIRNGDIDERISHAKTTMNNYIEDGVLVRLPKGVVLVERQTAFGTRVGVMLAVDLEKYDVDASTKPLYARLSRRWRTGCRRVSSFATERCLNARMSCCLSTM